MIRAPRATAAAALLSLTFVAAAGGLQAQERVYHSLYLPASHNWVFRAQFPSVDRLFNAFDYGHGILYETLWSRPDAPVALLEDEIFDRLTTEILVDPPRLPMPESAFMPNYARLVPRAKEMFDWAHILHKQTYDVLADVSLSEAEKDEAMDEVLAFYLSSDLAFTDVPKGMMAMDEQYFSMAFRDRYPAFNGLIWAYHWLQVGVYEPLLAHSDAAARQASMAATVARFWQMVEGGTSSLPSEMPMTPAVSPMFTARYPRIAAIFDNLHMMHDVISDILVSDEVARDEKRAEIYRQVELFRNDQTMSVSDEEWIDMAIMHGVDAQGGPVPLDFPSGAGPGGMMPMDRPMRMPMPMNDPATPGN